jgi:hypothetical protein
MLLAWMDETFGNDSGTDWLDEDAAAVGDALNKAVENFKRMRAACGVTAVVPPKTKPCPNCAECPGMMDTSGHGDFDVCDHCGGSGEVADGVPGTDLAQPAWCPVCRQTVDKLCANVSACERNAGVPASQPAKEQP